MPTIQPLPHEQSPQSRRAVTNVVQQDIRQPKPFLAEKPVQHPKWSPVKQDIREMRPTPKVRR
jgi:hypothetical protein